MGTQELIGILASTWTHNSRAPEAKRYPASKGHPRVDGCSEADGCLGATLESMGT